MTSATQRFFIRTCCCAILCFLAIQSIQLLRTADIGSMSQQDTQNLGAYLIIATIVFLVSGLFTLILAFVTILTAGEAPADE